MAGRIRSVGVSCEHRNNDCRGNQVQSNKSDPACCRVSELQRGHTGERSEPDGDPDEPPTGGSTASDQEGEEGPADDCTDEGDLDEPGQWDLAVRSQRDSGSPQDSRTAGLAAAAKTPTEAVARGSVLVRGGMRVLDVNVGGGNSVGHRIAPFMAAVLFCTAHPVHERLATNRHPNSRFLTGSTRTGADPSVRYPDFRPGLLLPVPRESDHPDPRRMVTRGSPS